MATRKRTSLVGLFFMAAGSVCAGPAIGADRAEPAAVAQAVDVAPELERIQDLELQSGAEGEKAPDSSSGGASTVQGPTGGASEGPEMVPMTAEQGEDDALPDGQKVEVGSFGQIDLHVNDLDIAKVLQLLSMQSKRNIVASKNVSGTVSADLYDVDFYEALDAILQPNGYGYREKGNFIYVYTRQELEEIRQQERQVVTRVMHLDYLPAADASTFVNPLLSSAGSISVSGQVPSGMSPDNDAGANSFSLQETLVIRDYPENVEEIVATLEQVEARPKQVLIEATVLQARLREANAFGVDFALFADLDALDFTSPLGAVDDLLSDEAPGTGGAVGATPGNVASGESSIKLGYLGSDAAVFVRALDSVTDTTVLATPKLLVLNRQRAELLVGQKLGYLSSTATETSTTQTVEFLDVGTELNVRPFVSEDGFVRMELNPSVSDGETTFTEGFVIPNETTQEMTTNVIVESGQTVVLGGLFKEDTNVDRQQVPGLGDVPIIGSAFRGQDDEVVRDEVIFLIKPTIVKDRGLAEAGERAMRSTELAAVGARRNLLPWSKTKLTTSYVREAHEALRKGDQEKALWYTNTALYLDPTMMDALRLKERLTGERFYLQDKSILEDAIDSLLDEELNAALETPDEEAEASEDEGQAADGEDAQ